MTPDKIAQMIASGDKEQIKQAQRLLQGLGFYMGPIDGVLRNKKNESATLDAVKSYRTDFTDNANRVLKGRELDAGAEERSWQNQALQAAPWLALPAGLAYGYHKGKKIERRQLATEAAQRAGVLPDAPRNWSPARRFAGRFAPYAGQAGMFAAEGLALRELVAPQIPNKTAKQLTQAGGTGLVAAGVGTAAAGWGNAFTPQTSTPTPSGPPPAPPANALAAAGRLAVPPPSSPPTAPSSPSTPSSGPRTNADRLISAARAAGATGKLNKQQAVDFLASSVNESNRVAVARELGIKPGRNFVQRIGDTVTKLAAKSGRSAILLPLAAGAYAAGEAGNEARAEGASPAEATGRSAAAGAAAGGTAAGGMYAMNKLAAAAPTAMRAAGGALSMAGPFAAADAYDPAPEELARDRNTAARYLPSFLRAGGIEEAYQMAQVPERSPANSGPRVGRDPRSAPPVNAMAAAGEQPDPFGQAFNDFMGMVQELQGAP